MLSELLQIFCTVVCSITCCLYSCLYHHMLSVLLYSSSWHSDWAQGEEPSRLSYAVGAPVIDCHQEVALQSAIIKGLSTSIVQVMLQLSAAGQGGQNDHHLGRSCQQHTSEEGEARRCCQAVQVAILQLGRIRECQLMKCPPCIPPLHL